MTPKYIYICTYIHTYTHTYTYIYIHSCMRTHTFIHMCIVGPQGCQHSERGCIYSEVHV